MTGAHATGRLPTLDGLRGVLALTIVGVHTASFLSQSPALMLSQIPVGIFFVMSGLVLTRAYDGRFGAFLLRRFIRLWPVYAVCLAAGYVLVRAHPVWLEFIWIPYPTYDGDRIDGPVWSLFIEAGSAFFMPLFVWSAAGTVWRSLVVCLGFVICAQGFVPLLFGPLFVIGAFLSRTEFQVSVLERPWAQWLGRVSYSLYLSHWLILKAGVMLFGPLGVLAALPAVLPIAWLVWRLIEHPSIKLSRLAGLPLSLPARAAG